MSDWKHLNIYIDTENLANLKKYMRVIDPYDLSTKVTDRKIDYCNEMPYTSGMCNNCGETVVDSMNYCPYCGFKLDWSKE